MWLVVSTAGAEAVSSLQPCVATLLSHCVHDLGPRPAVVSQTIARAVHAVLSFGPSPATRTCMNLWRVLRSEPCPSVRAETIRIQQLLTRPELASQDSQDSQALLLELLAYLKAYRSSRDVCVRRAALGCIRALAMTDAQALLKSLDRILLLLDAERDVGLVSLIHQSLQACVDFVLSSSKAPDWTPDVEIPIWHLLDVCKRAVVTQKLPSDAVFKDKAKSGDARDAAEEDDDHGKVLDTIR